MHFIKKGVLTIYFKMRLIFKLIEPISVVLAINFTALTTFLAHHLAFIFCITFSEMMDYLPAITDGISSFLGLIASIWGTYKAIKEIKQQHKNKENGKSTEI